MSTVLSSKKLKVRKRSGHITDYNHQKITQAVLLCLVNSCGRLLDAETKDLASRVTDRVEAMIRSASGPVNVEQIQDLVEQVLYLLGEHDAARQYIIYREEHRKLREEAQVDPATQKAFAEGLTYFTGVNKHLQVIQAFDKFARYREELPVPRREVWPETADRVMDFFYDEINVRRGGGISAEQWAWLKKGLLTHMAAPSMRAVQLAGPALHRCNSGVFNCAFGQMDSPESMSEDLYLLMQGCGFGFSVENDNAVAKWPRVRRQLSSSAVKHVVPDTTEGWCDALKFGLRAWLAGDDVEFDYSQIREEGVPLKTKGGTSSGPGPLRDLMRFARGRILSRQGQCLTSLDIHDITCFAHRIVQMGGVRRASGISLSDLNDAAMRDCKSGQFFNTDPQRNQANNSACYDFKPSMDQFIVEWSQLVRGKSGERGIFNREGAFKCMPGVRAARFSQEDRKTFGCNPCVTGDTLVYVADGRTAVTIKDLADAGKDVPVFCLDENKGLTIRYMRRPRLTGSRVPVLKVTLDDGYTVRVTPNHKFMLRSGEYREARDLRAGDSLRLVTRVVPENCDETSYSRDDRYIGIRAGRKHQYYEHVLIAAFHAGRDTLIASHVHHENKNRFDNQPDNLIVKTASAHLAAHSGGDENPHYSGVPNSQLIVRGRSLTRSLGRRFSAQDWVTFAQDNDLPQHFSDWRQKSLGSITAFAKLCASQEGITAVDTDPRVIRTYQDMLAAGLTAEIIDDEVFVHKQCEFCGCDFTVKHTQREQAYCSLQCSSAVPHSPERLAKQRKAQKVVFSRRRKLRREQQLEVYAELKNKLHRQPQKLEWVAACRSAGVSPEVSRPSSPFTSWNALLEAAAVFNHRVVSVEPDGNADVYNGTVDDYHNYMTGGWVAAGLTPKGRRNTYWVVNANCGEILLKSRSFCNLSVGVLRPNDPINIVREKIAMATAWGTMQSALTRFNYLRDDWRNNAEEERLLGVDMLGHLDHFLIGGRSPMQQRGEILRDLRATVTDVNLQWAKTLGIAPSLSATCNKPSGDSSVFYDTSAGFMAHHGQWFIRRLRFKPTNPIAQLLKDENVPYRVDYDNSGLLVFEFPCRAPVDNPILLGEKSAIEQLEDWKCYKINWTSHNPSVTVYVRESEWLAVGNWVYENWDIVGGLSFFPLDESDHIYELAPYQKIDEVEYTQRMSNFPEIDWSKLVRYEKKDTTELKQHMACAGGQCTI